MPFIFSRQKLREIYSPRLLWHYGYLQRVYANNWVQKELMSHVVPNSCVLDFGCGESPQKKLIEDQLGNYFGIDIKETSFGVIFDGTRAPFEGGIFDVVLLSEVLYAIPDSRNAISECHRLLRVGGTLLVSANFIYPLNSNSGQVQSEFGGDYFRFSEAGIREILNPFFGSISTSQLGGLGGIFLMPQYFYRNHLMRNPNKSVKCLATLFAPIFMMSSVLLNLLGLFINRLDTSGLFATDIVAIATKET